MRIDITLRRDGSVDRDIALLAPQQATWAQVADAVAAYTGVQPETVQPLRGRGTRADGAPCGVRNGDVLLVGRDRDPVRLDRPLRLRVVGGPDCGGAGPIGTEYTTVGRDSQSGIVLTDPSVSREHASLRRTASGVQVCDLDSTNGTFVDGRRVRSGGVRLDPNALLRVGDSYLSLEAPDEPPATTHPAADGRIAVNRAPWARAPGDFVEIALPQAPERGAAHRLQLVGLLAPAIAGAVFALTLSSPMFLLLAVAGPLALLASWTAGAAGSRRARRRDARTFGQRMAEATRRVEAALAAEGIERRTADPDAAALARTAQVPGISLWSRRRDDSDILDVRLGLADLESATRVREGAQVRAAGTAASVPLLVRLRLGPLGIVGPSRVARALARWIVLQLAVRVSPDDLEFALLVGDEAEPSWRWMRWLPHLRGPVAQSALTRREAMDQLLLRRAPETGQSARSRTRRWLVIVIDHADDTADPPGLAEVLDTGEANRVAALCVGAQAGALPMACRTIARVVGVPGTRIALDAGPADAAAGQVVAGRVFAGRVVASADQLGVELAEGSARALAALITSGGRSDAALPQSAPLLPLLGLDPPDPASVVRRWRGSDATPSAVIGVGTDGPVTVDLARDGPHALIVGTTGSGKSELLRTLVAGMAATHPPDAVEFVLVDYKGGAAFAECAALPHTAGVVTDLDAQLTARALRSLACELRRREAIFAAAGVRDLAEYRSQARPLAVPATVLVVDELAALVQELPEFVSGLVTIAQKGRSLGIHLVLATQRAAGAVPSDVRANTALRIALRVTDAADSLDVIDRPDAADLDRACPGRALVRIAGGTTIPVQTSFVGGTGTGYDPAAVSVLELDRWRGIQPDPDAEAPAISDLGALVAAIRRAASERGLERAHSPWLPPLPDRTPVPASGAASHVVPLGVVDLPDQQARAALQLDLRRAGSVVFAGGPRSGRTTALCTLALVAAQRLSPRQLQVQVIDFAGGELAVLERLPHVGSTVTGDIATAARVLTRLLERCAQPAGEDAPVMLCLLDGWENFVDAAEDYDGGRAVDTARALLRAGPSRAVTVAVAGDRGALTPRLAAAVAHKIVLRLTDAADYALAGIATGAVPRDMPPGRALRAEDSAELQLAHVGEEPTDAARAEVIARIRTRWPASPEVSLRVRSLPRTVYLAGLRHAPGRVVIGLGGDTAEPIELDLIGAAARLLVAGPPRSGRSTLLATLLIQLAEGGFRILAAGPPRSPLLSTARRLGVTVLQPDDPAPDQADDMDAAALLVDDSDAFLDTPIGEWLASQVRQHVGRSVVVAGRSDELAVTFRGVAAHVRRAGCAVLLAPGPADGDLVGLRPTRTGTAFARIDALIPGRGVLVGDPAWGEAFAGGPIPIQVAMP